MAQTLEISIAHVPLRDWGSANLETGGSQKEAEEADTKKLWEALSKPRALVNVATQNKGSGKGKGKKGWKGKGKGKGKRGNKGKKGDDGDGKGGGERKPDAFILHIDHGERMHQVKSALQECLEQALRKRVGLKADAAWARAASVDEDDEVMPTADEDLVWEEEADKGKGRGDKSAEPKKEHEGGATASADVGAAAAAAAAATAAATEPATAPAPAGGRKRFLVWVEKTVHEQLAKKGKEGEKGEGKKGDTYDHSEGKRKKVKKKGGKGALQQEE